MSISGASDQPRRLPFVKRLCREQREQIRVVYLDSAGLLRPLNQK
jgi:hypothetical protein